MKAWAAGLITLLGTRSFVFCDLYTFTLQDGTVLRYTTAQLDILYAGNTYSARWVNIDQPGAKALAHWKIGLDTDTWVVYMMPDPVDPVTGAAYPATIYGQPWLAAVQSGALDGAQVQVDRAYWASWPAPAPTWTPTFVGDRVFVGEVASIDVMRRQAQITINTHMQKLDRLMPQNVYQASCRHTLFDSGCTLSQAAFARPGNTVIQVTPAWFNVTLGGAIPGSGTAQLGALLWNTGANAGLRMGLVNYSSLGGGQARIYPKQPTAFPITIGDTLTLYPGCDKQFTTCGAFGNQVNYGGTGMTVPAPEVAV
jgi:hypothetical protein